MLRGIRRPRKLVASTTSPQEWRTPGWWGVGFSALGWWGTGVYHNKIKKQQISKFFQNLKIRGGKYWHPITPGWRTPAPLGMEWWSSSPGVVEWFGTLHPTRFRSWGYARGAKKFFNALVYKNFLPTFWNDKSYGRYNFSGATLKLFWIRIQPF